MNPRRAEEPDSKALPRRDFRFVSQAEMAVLLERAKLPLTERIRSGDVTVRAGAQQDLNHEPHAWQP